MAKQTMFKIKHRESSYVTDVPKEEFDGYQDRIKAMYEVTAQAEVEIPGEIKAPKPSSN